MAFMAATTSTSSNSYEAAALQSKLLLDRQRLDITPGGEWSDGVQRLKTRGSLMDWVVGRRGSKATGHHSQVIHTGFLEKTGYWRKNWKRRHFVLFHDIVAWEAHASRSTTSAKVGDAAFLEAQQRADRMRSQSLRSAIPQEASSNSDFKALGDVRLCARGSDGQITVALVWDYSSAIDDGHHEASISVLELYAPTSSRSRSDDANRAALPASTGRTSMSPFFLTAGVERQSRSSAAQESELARCFGVRCASSGRDLFMRADTVSDAKSWIQLVQHQTYRALRDEVAASGAHDHLRALGDDDELSHLVPNRRSLNLPLEPNSDESIQTPTTTFHREQQPLTNTRIMRSLIGLGLSISMTRGVVPAEEGVIVSMFCGSLASSHLSLNSAEMLSEHLCSDSLAFAASTESISARDGANGAYEIPNDYSALNSKATLLLRQFSRLIPKSAIWYTKENDLLFVLHRKTSKSYEYSADSLMGYAHVLVTDVRNLLRIDGPQILLMPVIQLASNSNESKSSDGRSASSESWRDSSGSCSIAVSLVHSSESETTRMSAISQSRGIYADPYASSQYRFNVLNGQKVLAHSSCHISGYGVSVPLAVVSLLVKERSSAVAADQMRLNNRKRSLDKLIRREQEKLAMMLPPNFMPQEGATNTAAVKYVQDTLSILVDERARTAAELWLVEDLSRLVQSMSLCEELYAHLLSLAGQGTERGIFSENEYQRAASAVEAVKEIHAAGKYLLKRSTKKDNGELRFLATNLNTQILHARTLGTSLGQDEALSPLSSTNEDSFSLSTFVSVTLGCPAAHSMGFKNGGLSRILSESREGEVNGWVSKAMTEKCLKLMDWSIPASRLQELNEASRKASELEGKATVPTVAKTGEVSSGSEKGASSSLDRENVERNVTKLLENKERSLIALYLKNVLSSNAEQNDPHDAIDATKRLDAVTTQVLAAAVTQVLGSLNCAVVGSEPHRRVWPWILRVGFLFSLQSLVSTCGNERGMLEDLIVALEWLSTCSIRFVRKAQQKTGEKNSAADDSSVKTASSPFQPKVWARRLRGSRSLVILLEVDNAVGEFLQWAASLSGNAKDGVRDLEDVEPSDGDWDVVVELSLVGVVFQQGINEQQAMSNAMGNAAHAFQSSINEASFERVKAYYKAYKGAAAQIQSTSIDISSEITQWEEAFEALRSSVFSSLKTNVHLIVHASSLCRRLSGVHGICCKSGKDRTSMLVTLEEARLLGDNLGVIGGRKVCRTMRKFGVRRTNVLLNTGQTKYAFNDVQRVFLPPCFQPPAGTYSGNAVT